MTQNRESAPLLVGDDSRKNQQHRPACRTLMGLGASISLILWVFLALMPANAQTTGRGNITGTVTDPTGAVVVGASVTVTNTATGVLSTTVSNRTGYFEVDSIDPGTYSVTVKAPGFQELVRNGVVLNASNVLALPLTLKVGRSTESVTVTEQAPLLNTQSGLTGQSLTPRELSSLTESGDNPMELVELAPGVQSPAMILQNYTTQGAITWNGVSKFGTAGVTNSNEFDVDGAVNQGNGRANLISMSSDMASEVRIDTTDFDPAYGHTYGITETETTKSGTNMIHGSATSMYDANRWNALNRFSRIAYEHVQTVDSCTNGPSTSTACALAEQTYFAGVHENLDTFGVGGPVFIPKFYDGRNKFFWFVAGTIDDWSTASPTTASIPTVQERGGNFSDFPTATLPANYASEFQADCGTSTPYYGQYQLYDPYNVTMVTNALGQQKPSRAPFCGNIIPAGRLALNSTMAALINSWLPTPTNNQTTGSNYTYTSAQPQTFFQFTTREDYAFSDKDRVFLRFTRHHYTKGQPGIAPHGIDTQQGPKWAEIGALGWNHMFSSAINFDATLEGSNLETSYTNYPGYSAFPPSSVGLPSYLQSYAGAEATLPELVFGSNAYVQGGSGANSELFGNLNNAPSLYRTAGVRGNLTIVHGEHTFHMGAEWRAQHYSRGVQGLSSGQFTFDNTYTRENDNTNVDCPTCNNSYNLGLPSPSNYGLSYAAFLMGVPSTSAVNKQAPLAINTPYIAGYFGDTWRLTPKLTFMPGIRYEFEFGPVEDHNYDISEFDPSQPLAIAAPAQTAYASLLSSGLSASVLAALPSQLSVQGGPLYAGVNGAPIRQWNNNYRWLPRFGFSYQIRPNTVIRGGYGIFYDSLNATEWAGPTDQTNFTASTSDAVSAIPADGPQGYGETLSASAPPISNPFPVLNGSNFVAAVGSAAGNLSYAGASPTIYPQFLVPARAQRVNVSVEHQFGQSLMIEVGYLGSWSYDMSNFSAGLVNATGGGDVGNQNLDPTPANFYSTSNFPNVASNTLLGTKVTNPFALANFTALQTQNPAAYNQMAHSGTFTSSTVAISNLVRPYPFMGGLSEVNPIGQSHFQELMVTAVKRMSHGLDLNLAYQKNYQYDRDYYQNAYDTQMSWEPSNSSYPWRLTVEGLYELPFGRGKMWANSGLASAILGGFQLGGTWEFSPGPLIELSSANNMFYVGSPTASNIKMSKPTYYTNITSGTAYVQWLNPGNVTATVMSDGSCTYSGTGFVTASSCQPNGYNVRSLPTRINGVRAMGADIVMANMKREFKIREGVNFEARFDANNLFNHQTLAGPNVSPTNSQFGWVTGTNDNARYVDIQGHISF